MLFGVYAGIISFFLGGEGCRAKPENFERDRTASYACVRGRWGDIPKWLLVLIVDRRRERTLNPKLLTAGCCYGASAKLQRFGIRSSASKNHCTRFCFHHTPLTLGGGVGGGCLVLPVLVLQSCWSVCSLGPAVCSSYAICGTKFKIG